MVTKTTCTSASRTTRYRSEVMRDEDATLCGGHRHHVRVAESVQLCGARGDKVDRRFTPDATGNDRVMKAGVR